MTTDATNPPRVPTPQVEHSPTAAIWDAAMQALADAEAAHTKYHDEVWKPLDVRYEGWMIGRGATVNDLGMVDLHWRQALLKDHPYREEWERAADHIDRLADAVAEVEGVLIGMPAPHASALLWKLDKLLCDGEQDGPRQSTPSWSADYVYQTVADYRRMLG